MSKTELPPERPGIAVVGAAFRDFVKSQVGGSVILLGCTIIALVWANSPWADTYAHLLHTKMGVSFGEHSYKLSLHHWVNDALMALFFFVVGLEVKRELVVGELSTVRKAVLPVSAAIGGMLVPAALYAVFNHGGDAADGWGIPMATDIAFALGVLAMLGKRVPIGLKVFLAATAIADDIGAVLVIAVFYTEQIKWGALIDAGCWLVLLLVLVRLLGVRRVGVLMVPIIGIWIGVFESGVHATIAGIVVAMLVPVRPSITAELFMSRASRAVSRLRRDPLTSESVVRDRDQLHAVVSLRKAAQEMEPPGIALEHALHPLQSYVVLPLFALANAGVALDSSVGATLTQSCSIGILMGLVLGKPVGIALASWLAVRSGQAELPANVSWKLLIGAGCLGGIGFTMSLFISDLAFADPVINTQAKIGILVASCIAGIAGAILIARNLPGEAKENALEAPTQ